MSVSSKDSDANWRRRGVLGVVAVVAIVIVTSTAASERPPGRSSDAADARAAVTLTYPQRSQVVPFPGAAPVRALVDPTTATVDTTRAASATATRAWPVETGRPGAPETRSIHPVKFTQIKVLTKSQATAVAVALKAGDAATVSGLIPEPYSSTLNILGGAAAPLFEACGTDGLPGGCLFGFESNPGIFGFQVVSIGAI